MAHRQSVPRALPSQPNLDQLKRQAKELLRAVEAGEAEAEALVQAHHRNVDRSAFALHDAQLVLARSYGFDSWPKLKAYVDGATVARLADAITSGDVSTVRSMLKARPELVHMDRAENNEHQALHYAVLARSPEMVRILMAYGANPHKGIYPHRDATTAMAIATERGYDDVVQALQTAPATANVTGGVAAGLELIEAIFGCDTERVVALITAHPDLMHARHPEGWTVLHVAAATLNESLVTWLLDRDFDPNVVGKNGWTPIDCAAAGPGWPDDRGPREFVALAELLRRRGARLTPMSAVALGDVEWIRSHKPSDSRLVSTAVRHDRPEVLALLLELGHDPDERARVEGLDEVVYTWGAPLQICAGREQLEMARLLLAHGADPNGEIYASGTPVSSAYRARDKAMLDLLISHGGLVQAVTAAYHRDTELARRYLAEESEGRLKPGTVSPGKTVAEDLLDGDCGDPEMIRMALERLDWPRDDPRWRSLMGGPLSFWNHIPWIQSDKWPFDRRTYITCFRLILARSNPNLVGTYGRTIFHDVMAMGRRNGVPDWITEDEVAQFAEAVLDAGGRMDVRDELLKSTPLGWACRWGREKVVKLLLVRGADPIEADAEAWATPLGWATKMGHTSIAALLKEFRADSDSRAAVRDPPRSRPR